MPGRASKRRLGCVDGPNPSITLATAPGRWGRGPQRGEPGRRGALGNPTHLGGGVLSRSPREFARHDLPGRQPASTLRANAHAGAGRPACVVLQPARSRPPARRGRPAPVSAAGMGRPQGRPVLHGITLQPVASRLCPPALGTERQPDIRSTPPFLAWAWYERDVRRGTCPHLDSVSCLDDRTGKVVFDGASSRDGHWPVMPRVRPIP